uniref:Ig-like domain-containing protein n=1 Tax=Dicentrarchus labrax TaxID=13489 RepID=A0A8C4DSU6_DICLA
MKHWLRNILILTLWLGNSLNLLICKGEDRVTQPPGDVIATEGETVTLGCTFETSYPNPTLFWYKQDGNNSPKFILSRIQRDEGNTAAEFKERFSSTLNSTLKSVPLKIQKLQLSDSAVYYLSSLHTLSNYSGM